MNKAVLACIGTGVIAGAAGAVAGYFYAHGRLEHEYNQRFAEEIERELDAYDRVNKTGRYSNIEDLAAERLPKRNPGETIPEDIGGAPFDPPKVTDEELVRTIDHLKYNPDVRQPESWENGVVLTEVDDESDTTTDRDDPYVISVEVFKAAEKGYETPQLFYYMGDKVLVDSQGDVVDIESYVGSLDVLTKFGHGSNEIDFLYVRNDRLSCDFEIERFHDSYESR